MKKRSAVTQKQIAKHAGVSQTLVSLALNGSYDVTLSEETRQRVLDVADSMGYVPQVAARSLVKGRSDNIGLVLIKPHYQVFRDPYIPNVITGISGVVRAHDYRLLVEHIDDLNNLNTIPQMLKGGEVAGIVLSGFSGVEHLVAPLVNPLVAEGYPIVILNGPPAQYNVVSIDHPAGVKQAAEHIIALGHRQVGCIAFGPSDPHINERLNAFVESFAARGIELNEGFIRYGQYDPESGYEAMQSILKQKPLPTALFGMNDMMAIGAMRAIQDAGLRVPEDIAVVGYDDMRFAAFTNPSLTTIHAPEIEQGHDAGEMLLHLISESAIPQPHVSLNPVLMVRRSCGNPKTP